MRLRRSLLLTTLLCLIVAAAPAFAQDSGRRIVAIGDVHGDHDALVDLLEETGLIDSDIAWTGGDAVLVQTGDLVGGGTEVKAVLDLMMRLQDEAAAAGGEVVVLLGDQEVLAILGELRDTNVDSFAAFAADNQEEYVTAAFGEFEQAYLRMERNYQAANRSRKDDLKEEWIADQAPGRIEYLRAMGPDGEYGQWIRSLPVMAMVENVLFMHASFAPQLAAWTPEAINERIAAEIAIMDASRAVMLEQGFVTTFGDIAEHLRAIGWDTRTPGNPPGVEWFEAPREMLNRPPELPEGNLADMDPKERAVPILRMSGWFLLQPRGPIFSQGYAEAPDGLIAAQIPGLMDATGARMVVASPAPSEDGNVRVRHEGSLYLIDTMGPGGSPSALVIEGDAVEMVGGN